MRSRSFFQRSTGSTSGVPFSCSLPSVGSCCSGASGSRGLRFCWAFYRRSTFPGRSTRGTQAGGFGARRFVGATVIFAVWGATLFALVASYTRRAGVVALASVFMLWNVGLMVQFGLGLMNRDRLIWREVVTDQFREVPPRLMSVVGRYLFARDELPGRAPDVEDDEDDGGDGGGES